MSARSPAILLVAGLAAAAPAFALAQSAQPSLEERWPAPAQQLEQRGPAADPAPPVAQSAPEPAPAAPPAPAAGPAPAAASPAPASTPKPAAAAPKPSAKPGEPPRSVACSGPFGRKSSHAALVAAFNAKNLTFAEVEGGPEGSKLMASVLFPNDPKRRLEVLWRDEESRAETHRVVINGKSTWSGPKGLRLGLTLAAVEKINGKPFKLQGADQDSAMAVSDWDGGALADVPGGCLVGVAFTADPKAGAAPRGETADGETADGEKAGGEIGSNDAAARALKLTVSEILIGYAD